MINKKILLPIIILVLLALALTGCVSDKTFKEPVHENPTVGEQTPDKDNIDGNLVEGGDETMITPMAAFDIYTEKHPTTKVRKIQLDNDRGIYTYKVEGYENGIEYELKLDAVNGDIIKEESEKENDLDKDGEILRSNVEKIEEYVNKVLEQAGEGSNLDEWTLKSKNGRSLLEVEVDLANGNDIEHTYDIETGELVDKDD